MSGHDHLPALVNLPGVVPSQAESDRAELYTCHLFGVDKADDRIEARA